MVLLVSDSNLWLEHADLGEGNVAALKVIVVLKRNIAGVPVVVGRTVGLFEARVLLSHLHLALHHATEVPSCENTVVRDQMVHGMRLEPVEMLEASSIRVAKQEWHVGITVIDCIEFLAVHKLLEIVLDNGALVDCCCLGSGGVDADAITKGKDVLEALVLESVGVHINDTLGGGNT